MAGTGSRRWRSTSRARSLKIRSDLGNVRSDRSSSRSTDMSEKILNTDLNEDDSYMFIAACNTFESLLKEFNLSEDSHQIQDKLTKIASLIQRKVSLSKKSNRKSSNPLLKMASLSVNDLPQTTQSQSSENTDNSLKKGNSRFKNFMKEVNCPFCSEIQSDKVSFVKHLDRSCSVHFKKEFKKEAHIPYSAFQILPNNLIKCNICPNQVQDDLRHYYDHTQCQTHKHSLLKASRIRDYDNRIFCAACKALVYNTYTQIKGHIDHEAHKTRCEIKKTTGDFLRIGIHFVFTEAYKFKCLDCPASNAVCNTPKSALEHLDNPNHKKRKKQNTLYSPAIYCEVCSIQVQLYEIITHFGSSQHCANEKKLKEESFEVCVCCNFFCKSQLELSKHMESDCDEINNLRKKIPKESQQEKEENMTKGPSITVKDCTKIPALFRYFSQFGEIVTIETHNDKDVVIEFREKSAVDDVLMLQDVIVMDGTKLKIVTDLNSVKPAEKPRPETESESEDSESSSTSEDDADLGNGASLIQDARLDELFARVSSYLTNTAQKLNSHEKIMIQHDCVLTLGTEKWHFVGFSGSELSFPNETLNLFCESLKSTSCENSMFASAEKSQMFTENLLKAAHISFCDSDLWQNVKCRMTAECYPFVECVHRNTKKACRILVSESALLLTDMLKECMEKNELVKPFCLMIRFWLSVHELKIKDFEFALIALLVFFLISAKVVTLSEEKYTSASKVWFYLLSKEQVSGFPTSLRDLKPMVSVKELFQKFLQFMDSFDFDKYAICLPLRAPIRRSACTQIVVKFLLPSLSQNISSLKNSSICILDPASHDNLAADINRKHKKEFLKVVSATVKHYKIK